MQNINHITGKVSRHCGRVLLVLVCMMLSYGTVYGQSSTLLINTESFQTIDDGDGTTNVELRFGDTLNNKKLLFNVSTGKFEFTQSLHIHGDLSATGSLTVQQHMSGASLRVSGNAAVHGGLSATGAIRTDSDLTINDDRSAADAALTFGNATANQTIKYLNGAQKFQFSDDVSVVGNLSGSSLTIDGAATFRNIQYLFPTAQGGSNTFLKNDGAGNLSWSTNATANGSGGIVSMHPEYAGAVYFSSGATAVGTLSHSYDATNKENYYHWTTSKGTIQDYWIAARVRVPKNFANWAPTPIQFRYKTLSTSAAVNHITFRLLDTAGNAVAISNGGNLVSGSGDAWTTANIGNLGGGTFTPDGFITILIKAAATSSGHADPGYINLNWSTTTP